MFCKAVPFGALRKPSKFLLVVFIVVVVVVYFILFPLKVVKSISFQSPLIL